MRYGTRLHRTRPSGPFWWRLCEGWTYERNGSAEMSHRFHARWVTCAGCIILLLAPQARVFIVDLKSVLLCHLGHHISSHHGPLLTQFPLFSPRHLVHRLSFTFLSVKERRRVESDLWNCHNG